MALAAARASAARAATAALAAGSRSMGSLAGFVPAVAAAPASCTARAEDVTDAEARAALERSQEPGARFPAGALTLKPVAFKYRKWELQRHDTVCPFDACGTPIYAFSKQWTPSPYETAEDKSMGGERVMRVLPIPDEDLMSDAISDKTRFGWEGIYKNRMTEVRVHRQDKTISTDVTEMSLHAATNSHAFRRKISPATLGPLNI